jgi:hypothetical protein
MPSNHERAISVDKYDKGIVYDWCLCASYTSIYGGGNQAWSSLITGIISPFYVNAFFVVSGYLFFMKWLNLSVSEISQNIRKSMLNILFRLIIPTLFFASVLYLPKLYFNSNVLSVGGYMYDVLGGISFWFTSAMAICNILMLSVIAIGIKSLKTFSIIAIVAFTIALFTKGFFLGPFPWYWRTGMAAMAFMTIGGGLIITES